MTHTLTSLRGIPRRLRIPKDRPSPEARALENLDPDAFGPILPFRVVIEVLPGRTSTASAMRAAQIQQKLEKVGAAAWAASVDTTGTTVHAEVDAAQLRHAASLPFVKRISRS